MANRSRSAEQVRLARTRVIRFTDMFGTIGSFAIKWGAIAFIAYQIQLCVTALSGQQTFVSVFANVAGNITVNKWVAYSLGAGGAGYGVLQRRLRKAKVAELGGRIRFLENKIDPNRTSSGLDADGTTPKDH